MRKTRGELQVLEVVLVFGGIALSECQRKGCHWPQPEVKLGGAWRAT